MTATTATDIIYSAVPDHGVRNIERIHDEIDDVTIWTGDVFDPYMDEGDDLIGHVTMMEHYPEPDVTWL